MLEQLAVAGTGYDYYSLKAAQADLGLAGIERLPKTLKLVLENQLRLRAEGLASDETIAAIAAWLDRRESPQEIGFRFGRVLMPDSSGVPLLGDLAAMREALASLGGDPARLNPTVPVDLVVDHSGMVEFWGEEAAAAKNLALEMRRNQERYEFIRWGAGAFDNLRVIPPGSGICHQVNIESLATVVTTREVNGRLVAFPDSVLGMDSHTPMVNALGVLGWGVGGIEGGNAALGEPIPMLMPQVIGVKLSGHLRPGITATDLVLTLTQLLRTEDLVGKFVEYFGEGVAKLSTPHRATVANMTPEIGSTVGFFPVDEETLRYLRETGRAPGHVALVEMYCKAQGLWGGEGAPESDYTRVIEFDLRTVERSVAGPSRPQDRMPLSQVPAALRRSLPGGRKESPTLQDGDVVIAAITSCTNTANPSAMVAAGLLARNAVRAGLRTREWVKTSLSPGSLAVADYLNASGLQEFLDRLGFHAAGFGCMTCMGNSGPLPVRTMEAIDTYGVTAAAVLSGNRNFEGRVHPAVRANFLASPPLVVAYALAGTVSRDIEGEPLGEGAHGKPVYLRDIWPPDGEVAQVVAACVKPAVFTQRYAAIEASGADWRAARETGRLLFPWREASTFIRKPPFFAQLQAQARAPSDIRGARILAMFGDMVTTDHISPVAEIPLNTAAARYLQSQGVLPRDFVSYAARRLNHDVMVRGTFGNVRIRNELVPGTEGGVTRHAPGGELLPVHEAADRYRAEGVPLIVVAGALYGAGSSRDWAAKGVRLLGVRAVIAESFERIHRSNLVGMGVLPLELPAHVTRETLQLNGMETIDLQGIATMEAPGQAIRCTITHAGGRRRSLQLRARIDTQRELEYFRNGGLLEKVIRDRLQSQ
ncbi:aconitate hydratase AcnA [Caenimonas aquaedulcis]|uniref:Aconitate hydratase n=1 Tax=Caenimonas aquaedulcis TaxID=2793270 RepID=A0A931H3Y2_9BURK|nr:aconitate hydratase AcnA [Caenimonas aquaedulcis]MBG9388072.1 aconitate hydratase AcnA [Caenimonas aquaedulcis]